MLARSTLATASSELTLAAVASQIYQINIFWLLCSTPLLFKNIIKNKQNLTFVYKFTFQLLHRFLDVEGTLRERWGNIVVTFQTNTCHLLSRCLVRTYTKVDMIVVLSFKNYTSAYHLYKTFIHDIEQFGDLTCRLCPTPDCIVLLTLCLTVNNSH